MKNFELKPTFENIKETLIHDSLGRLPYIKRFAKLLDSIEFNTSIALNGNWGTGKTFFVKQLMLYLIVQNQYIRKSYTDEELIKIDYEELKNKLNFDNSDEIKKLFIPVYYDAWKNDNATDPILSIINETIKSICDFGKLEGQRNVKKCVSEIVKTVVGSGKLKMKLTPDSANPGSYISGEIDGEKLAQGIDALKYLKRKNLLRSFDGEDELHAKINNLFQNYLAEKGNQFVIFIDELDRCRPSYAIKLLEKIKHYFDIDNIIFVFSTNQKELQNTVRKFYGNDFDGYRYLNKFFDFTINLPNLSLEKYFYVVSKKLSTSYINKECVMRVVKQNDLSMRDISRFLSIYDIAMANYKELANSRPDQKLFITYSFCEDFIIPIAIFLLLIDQQAFSKFLNGDGINYLQLYFSSDNNQYMSELKEHYKSITNKEPDEKNMTEYLYYNLFAPEKLSLEQEEINNFYKCTCIDESIGNRIKEILTLLSNLSSYDK